MTSPSPQPPGNPWSEQLNAVLPVLHQHAGDIDRSAEFPRENLTALRASGLLGLLIPREHGGLGGTLNDLSHIAQHLAGACLSTAMIWAMHCQQVDILVRHAPPRLRDELLPAIAGGGIYLASVTTEPGTGGHLLSAHAPAHEQGYTLSFERDAPVITGATAADGFLITLRESPDAPDSQVCLVYAHRSQLTLQLDDNWDPLGMRGTHSVSARLEGTIPTHQRVTQPRAFRGLATDSLIPIGHIAWAACWLGAAHHAYQRLIRHLSSKRSAHSTPLTSPLTAERLARARNNLELVSSYLNNVITEIDHHREAGTSTDSTPTQLHINTLKVIASELTYETINQLIQLAGLTHGYQRASPLRLEQTLRDLRSTTLNYNNDRLLIANGHLTLLDRQTRLLDPPPHSHSPNPPPPETGI